MAAEALPATGSTASRRVGGAARPRRTQRRAERGAAPARLTLPRLTGVSACADPFQTEAAVAYAGVLLDAGLLTPQFHWYDRSLILPACEAALQHWLDGEAGTFRVLDLGLTVQPLQTKSIQEGMVFELQVSAGSASMITCAPVLHRLRAIDRSLPRVVLNHIERLSWRTVPLGACCDQLGMAEWSMWGGCRDAIEHAREMGITGDERQQYLDSVLTRAQIKARTPAWVLGWSKRAADAYSAPRLRAIAARCRDALCAQVLVSVAALLDSKEVAGSVHESAREDGGEFVGYGAVLRYDENDYTDALLEHIINYALEGGVSYELLRSHSVAPGDVAGMREWAEATAQWLRQARLLDHLTWLLSGAESLYGTAEETLPA